MGKTNLLVLSFRVFLIKIVVRLTIQRFEQKKKLISSEN